MLEQVIRELNSRDITTLDDTPEALGFQTVHYNCWGFTAMLLGWKDEAIWLDDSEMNQLLATRSKAVNTPAIGDIAVFRRTSGRLVHTAVMIGTAPMAIIHKPGGAPLESVLLTECYDVHDNYGEVTEYRRPIRPNRRSKAETDLGRLRFNLWYRRLLG